MNSGSNSDLVQQQQPSLIPLSGANSDLVPSVNINWPNRQGPI